MMNVERLDHVNIVTDNVDETARFFEAALGLIRCNAPSPLTPEQALWMQTKEGHHIIHINSTTCPRQFDRPMPKGPTGPIHHVALNCKGYSEFLGRVESLNIEWESNEIASVGLKQLFLHDPNGVLLELNFFEG